MRLRKGIALAVRLSLVACLPGAVGIVAKAGAPVARAAGLASGGDAANRPTSHDLNLDDDGYEEYPGGEQTMTFRIRLAPAEKVALYRDEGPFVVVAVFSGRRSSEEILLSYLRKLLKAGSIDEILLTVVKAWPGNRKWLDDVRESGEFSMEDIPTFTGVYTYLARTWTPPAGRRGDAVVVKCDDDIVYVDLEHFDGFVRYIGAHPDMFLVFANTVNNQVAAHYQQQHGAIPRWSRGVDMEMPYPGTGTFGRLFDEPETAVELHDVFLRDPQRFSWKAKENDGCIVYQPPNETQQQRFSINFFGYRYSNRGEVARLAENKVGDEVGLTTMSPHTNCMYTEFVVAHYSFNTQRKALRGTDILDRYAKLRNQSALG